jgi:hypothetical protein
VASKTSDVAPNAPTVGEAVAPISTLFLVKNLLYFPVFRTLHSFVFLPTFLCSLGIRVGATTNLEGGSGRAIDLPSFFVEGFFKDPKYCS